MKHLLSFNENLNPRPYLSISKYVEIRDYIHDVSQDIKDEGFSIFNYRSLDNNNNNVTNFSIEFRNIFHESGRVSRVNNFKWEDIKDTINHLISYITEETNNLFTIRIEYVRPDLLKDVKHCTLDEFLKRVSELGSLDRLTVTFINKSSSKSIIGNSTNSRNI